MTIRNASWWSVSAVVLACGLVGCPAINTPPDTGSDALDAFEPSDAYRGRDVAVVDRDAPDAGHDSGATDAGADANTNDAAVCDCDDGIACTRDRCDAARSCVHWSACDADEICNTDGTCSATPTCASALECPRDWFCEELLGCLGGRCAYRWNPDRDGDGVSDQGCGGNDCAPLDRTIPRVETCNSVDDDCNGRIDDRAGLDSDPNNCGACRHNCMGERRDICVAGMCVCSADHTLCDRGDGCFDLETDPLHCGSCDTVCPDGSTCEAGLCRYRATWMHGVDVGAQRIVWFAPNGDIVFETDGRPTRLFHGDRPAEDIAPGPSPFARDLVRLDRDGNLVGITSLPILTLDRYDWHHAGDGITVTDEGIYFVGHVDTDADILGTHFTPTGSLALGYVPRATGEIAWAQPLVGGDIYGLAGLRDGSLALLVTVAGRVFGPPELRRFGRDGAALPHETRFDELLLSGARAIWPSAAGGFVVLAYADAVALEAQGVSVVTESTFPHSAALVFGPTGFVERAVVFGNTALDEGLFDERVDGSSWLVQDSDLAVPVLADLRRDGRFTSLGARRTSPVESAAFDGDGVAVARATDSFSGTWLVERWRSLRIVESAAFQNVAGLHDDAVWVVQGAHAPFHLPGAVATVSRIDLPPIP